MIWNAFYVEIWASNGRVPPRACRPQTTNKQKQCTPKMLPRNPVRPPEREVWRAAVPWEDTKERVSQLSGSMLKGWGFGQAGIGQPSHQYKLETWRGTRTSMVQRSSANTTKNIHCMALSSCHLFSQGYALCN